jgi:predicted nucleic acid-binding protein
MGRAFLDTNIALYADDADAGAKRERAQEIIRTALTRGNAVISTQVLQEYFVVATRKLHVPLEIAQRKVELLATLDTVTVDLDAIVEAIKLCRLYSLSFWDALILCAARIAGCDSLLTEDMQDGQLIEGVRISNPFI